MCVLDVYVRIFGQLSSLRETGRFGWLCTTLDRRFACTYVCVCCIFMLHSTSGHPSLELCASERPAQVRLSKPYFLYTGT